MKTWFLLLVLLCSCLVNAQNSNLPEKDRFVLYLWYKQVGEETYKTTQLNDQRLIDISFNYEDRGTKVPMESHVSLTENFAPIRYTVLGKTGRFSVIKDSIVVEGNKLSVNQRDTSYYSQYVPNSFPHYASSPASLYLLMIKFWEANGRPASINCLPENIPIHISYAGIDSFMSSGRQVLMHRYRMERENFMVRYIWLNEEGGFAGMSSGFLSSINEKYQDLLHNFRTKTAVYTLKEYPTPSVQKDLVIRNARIVDIKTGKQTYPAVVIVKNGFISWVGPSSKAKNPE